MRIFFFQSVHFLTNSFNLGSKLSIKLLKRLMDATGHKFMRKSKLTDFYGYLFGIFIPSGCTFLRVIVDDRFLEDSVVVLDCHYVGSATLAEG